MVPAARLARLLRPHLVAQRGVLGNRATRWHCDSTPIPGARPVQVTFVDKKGAEKAVSGLEGDSLVAVAHKHEIDLEGACACSLACSTCHVILSADTYNALEPAGEDEEDLLDLAFGLTPTCVPCCSQIFFLLPPVASQRCCATIFWATFASPFPLAPPPHSLSGSWRSSRLGCQVRLSMALNGARVRLPAATRNMYVDGFVPKPH